MTFEILCNICCSFVTNRTVIAVDSKTILCIRKLIIYVHSWENKANTLFEVFYKYMNIIQHMLLVNF